MQRVKHKWLLLVCIYGLSRPAMACPISVFSHETVPPISGKRNHVFLFSLASGQANSWKTSLVQIDPVSDEGRLEFFSDEAWKQGSLGKYDRIVFEANGFGRKLSKSDAIPCDQSLVYEVVDRQNKGKYAYLTICKGDVNKSKVFGGTEKRGPISFNAAEHGLSGSNYRYQFHRKNHMLFSQIDLGRENHRKKIAWNSDILIKADIKNFFTFHFDSSDIESYLEDVYVGELGVNARVSFYLKILYIFTVKLSLTTDVSFYRDSANIPMVIHIPKGADNRVHSGSGILYNWQFDRTASAPSASLGLPRLDDHSSRLVKTGYKDLGTLGMKSCKGSSNCQYRYGMRSHGQDFVMDFKISRNLVKKGFFPLHVDSIGDYNEKLGWNVDDKSEPNRTGFYFETSGLAAGSHPWDFWLRLGSQDQLKHSCPYPAYIRKLRVRPKLQKKRG